MKNNKFLKVGAAALGAIALTVALGINHSEAQNHQQVQKPDHIVEMTENNPNKFVTISVEDVEASKEMPAGTVKEVTYKGKIIGEIRQHEKTQQINSNLSAEETVKLFHELQKNGQGEHLTLSDGIPNNPEYKNIVFDLGKPTKTYTSDVERIVLASSLAYRQDTVASIPNKEDVAKNIKAAREKYRQQHTMGYNYTPNAG